MLSDILLKHEIHVVIFMMKNMIETLNHDLDNYCK